MEEKQVKESKDVPKKTSKKTWFWTIVVILVLILISLNSGSNNNTQQSNSSPVASTTSTPSNSVCSDPSTIKANAKKISFATLNKDPDSFNGTDAEFTGQIVEIQESNGQGIIRLAVTKDPVLGWSFSDIIWVNYTGHNNFVKDDVVTVYGVLQGSYTYTSQANFQITLPSMEACSIEKPSVQKVSQTSISTATPANNTTTSTTVVTPTTPPATVVPKTWHTVTTYSISTSTQTPPFSMQGSEWRISYTCAIADQTQNGGAFNGGIYNTSDGFLANFFAQDVTTCPTNNTSYVYAQTPGQYYLNIEPFNVLVGVTVEDYY